MSSSKPSICKDCITYKFSEDITTLLLCKKHELCSQCKKKVSIIQHKKVVNWDSTILSISHISECDNLHMLETHINDFDFQSALSKAICVGNIGDCAFQILVPEPNTGYCAFAALTETPHIMQKNAEPIFSTVRHLDPEYIRIWHRAEIGMFKKKHFSLLCNEFDYRYHFKRPSMNLSTICE
jgi:hypothetical protein